MSVLKYQELAGLGSLGLSIDKQIAKARKAEAKQDKLARKAEAKQDKIARKLEAQQAEVEAKQAKKMAQFAAASDVAIEEIVTQGGVDAILAQGKAAAYRYWPWVAGGAVALGALWIIRRKKRR